MVRWVALPGCPPVLGCMAFLAVTATLPLLASTYMECSVKMCGVLVLSTGLGKGSYQNDAAYVHGLWPEVGQYGGSACFRPTVSSADLPYKPDEPELLQCYDLPPGQEMTEHEHWFVNHEWDKHGKCAGAADVNAFLTTTCGLAAAPLEVMTSRRRENGLAATTDDIADALRSAGYPVYDIVYGDMQEVYLSACADDSGVWKLAEHREFETVCPVAGDSPPSTSAGGQCLPYERGPKCSQGDSCSQYAGCLRCASSGYCTDMALSSEGQCVAMKKGPKCTDDGDCAAIQGCVRCAGSGYCTDVPLSGTSAGSVNTSSMSSRGCLMPTMGIVALVMSTLLLAGW